MKVNESVPPPSFRKPTPLAALFNRAMGFLVGLGTGPAGRPERVSRDRSCRGQQLRPEAQFELVLQGSPQIVGFHYVLDITVVEIKTVEGNQHMLDGEFPLHFEGLANGVSQGAGSFASAPDSLANAVSNLKSIFGNDSHLSIAVDRRCPCHPRMRAHYTHGATPAEDGSHGTPTLGFDLRIPDSVHRGA